MSSEETFLINVEKKGTPHFDCYENNLYRQEQMSFAGCHQAEHSERTVRGVLRGCKGNGASPSLSF